MQGGTIRPKWAREAFPRRASVPCLGHDELQDGEPALKVPGHVMLALLGASWSMPQD